MKVFIIYVTDGIKIRLKAIFKTEGQAKTSLTKLLKIMPEYKADDFSIAKIFDNYDIIKLSEFKR